MKNKLYEALEKRYEATISECEATLEIYFNNPAGIGEHPGILDEMSILIEKYATAVGNIEILKTTFSGYELEE
jgi:hypothetical protein